jgi:hypothetical protein
MVFIYSNSQVAKKGINTAMSIPVRTTIHPRERQVKHGLQYRTEIKKKAHQRLFNPVRQLDSMATVTQNTHSFNLHRGTVLRLIMFKR